VNSEWESPLPTQTIDQFVSNFPPEVQTILQKIRALIQKSAPGAEEAMAYGMPTFRLNGKNLVHFSAFKEHIGFYPTPSGIAKFKKELSAYEGAKGSVKFPLSKPIPYALIGKITQFRVKEVMGKTSAKGKRNLRG
jgi:uncharacterized protein YdhG (YjbR/CyaY superfamily)